VDVVFTFVMICVKIRSGCRLEFEGELYLIKRDIKETDEMTGNYEKE